MVRRKAFAERKTVTTYNRPILRKSGMPSLAELLQYAAAHRLLILPRLYLQSDASASVRCSDV
jgi:hypothetical protein